MVFNTSNIKRKFKYKSTVSAPSSQSQGPNRVSNVITNKINRPVTTNKTSTQKRTNSLSGASLSIVGTGSHTIIDKKETSINSQPTGLDAIFQGFNTWKDDTFTSFADKNALREAEAVKLESNIPTPNSDKQYPLYQGAPEKVNTGSDGMVKHDGYKNLNIDNSMTDKTKPRKYVKGMEARGESSNVSMGWDFESKPTGSTKSNSITSNLQFQSNTKVHSGMVDTWQKGFLTSPSRDKTSANHWLNAQLGKIDSMQGTDRNKNMFKKDLQGRYDGLFGSSNSPFQSQQNLKHNNISDGKLRLADKKEAKRLQAIQASQSFDSSSIQNQPPPKKIKPNTSPIQSASLIDDYNNLGSIY